MSESQREELLAQLNNLDKPKQRAKACKKLAATRDPSVIPALRTVYENDSDEKVQAAARAALTKFRVMEAQRNRGIIDRLLRTLLVLLVVAFIISLGLNAMALLSDDGDGDDTNADAEFVALDVTDRNELIVQVGSRLSEGQSLKSNLRTEINDYDATGQVDCTIKDKYTVPALLELSEDDLYTYPDIRLVSDTYNAVQPKFDIALKLFENACLNPDQQTESVIKAAQRLDEVEAQLNEANELLQKAIQSPLPTVGPTVTPQPPTDTPTEAPTAAPTATQPADSASSTTAPIGDTDEPTPEATAAVVVAAPTATFTPQPTPTLPLPNLDYAAILAELNARLTDDFLLDLQNPYGTGMLDQWEQSASARGQTTTNYCTLSAVWPEPFALTGEQQAQLDTPGVADPQLQEAIQLQQAAFDLAQQARPLYERDCPTSTLSNSADQGIELLSEAVENLDRTRLLLDEIAARP